MGPRSSRVIEILRETIDQAEQTPELGPYDPGVVELRRLLSRWIEEREGVRLFEPPSGYIRSSPRRSEDM
jgi:hypothetical protein